MPIDLNFTIAAPLLALAAGTLLILLLDLLFKYEKIHGVMYFAAIGAVLISGHYLKPLWLGGVEATGFSGFLMMDRFAVVYSYVLLIAALLAVLLSVARQHEDRSGYLALLLWGAMGMMALSAAGNLMMIFLGIELLSLALYVMIAFDPKYPKAREAAFKYFILGSVAAAFMIFGFALIYGATGTMSLTGIAAYAGSFAATGGWAVGLYFKVGIGLSIVGLAFKMALVPFHVWAPDVYQGAPTPVTAYMAIGTKAAAFAAMARLLVAAVPTAEQASFLLPVSVLAFASMMLGSTAGIWQTDLKRLMAYSGIANAGYLIMAIPGLGLDGLSAAAYFLAAYGFTTMGIFAVVRILEEEGVEGAKIANLKGLFYRRPLAGRRSGLPDVRPGGHSAGRRLRRQVHAGHCRCAGQCLDCAGRSDSLYRHLRLRLPEGDWNGLRQDGGSPGGGGRRRAVCAGDYRSPGGSGHRRYRYAGAGHSAWSGSQLGPGGVRGTIVYT